MIYFLYGLAGAGKSYVGRVIAEQYGYHFWEGDDALTPEMRQCLTTGQSFTQKMRDEFSEKLEKEIYALQQQINKPLIIAQGLYKQKNRDKLKQAFPNIHFVQITADWPVIAKRLESRKSGMTVTYATAAAKFFEPGEEKQIDNNPNQDLLQQLQTLLGPLPELQTTVNY